MSALRLAVIGAGHLGRFHAKLAKNLPGVELVAVVDPVESACTALAQEVGTEAVGDYRKLLDRIDAAVVATPTCTHHVVVKALLSHDKHVLVEKPITPTAAEASELVTLAEERDVTLQVGHVERFNPVLNLARTELQDVKFLRATRNSGYTFRSTDIGVVLDMMIHDIDLALAIVDSPVVGVSAIGASVLGGHEDLVTAELRFASGCVAQLSASRVSPEQRRVMECYSATGMVALDFTTRQATFIRPRADVLAQTFAVESLSPAEKQAYRSDLFGELLQKTTAEAPAVNAIEQELVDFATAIRTQRPPQVTGAAGRDAVAIAERILGCIDRHQWDGIATGRHGMFARAADIRIAPPLAA